MRDVLIANHPDVMETESIGRMPNNAIYHAEATTLLRAAAANGGTLSGRAIQINVDGQLCNNCLLVLPRIGLELGNPRIRIIDPTGRRGTIHYGQFRPGE
jgi:hypothetical protein